MHPFLLSIVFFSRLSNYLFYQSCFTQRRLSPSSFLRFLLQSSSDLLLSYLLSHFICIKVLRFLHLVVFHLPLPLIQLLSVFIINSCSAHLTHCIVSLLILIHLNFSTCLRPRSHSSHCIAHPPPTSVKVLPLSASTRSSAHSTSCFAPLLNLLQPL